MALLLLVFSFLVTDPTEVYTWGNNTNFSLGHGNQESRQHPELVDVFARTGVYIKQVGSRHAVVMSALNGRRVLLQDVASIT